MRKGYISKFEAKFFKEAKFWVRPNFEARPNLVSDIAKPGFGVCPDWLPVGCLLFHWLTWLT